MQINSHKERAKSEIEKFNGEHGITEQNEQRFSMLFKKNQDLAKVKAR